jgi:hypothetical protein
MPLGSTPLTPALPSSPGNAGRSSTRIISAMGVMPNSGSRENCQPEERAPTSLPST